jgi:hypothetical protein
MLEDLKEIRRIIDKFISKYEKQETNLYLDSDTQDDERLKEVGKQLLKLKGNEGVDEDEVQERWSRFDRWDGNDIY